MTLDLNKPVQLSDGRKARIICTDRLTSNWEFPVIALVMAKSGEFEFTLSFTEKGQFAGGNGIALINVPEPTLFSNVYIEQYNGSVDSSFGLFFRTKEEAIERQGEDKIHICIGIVEVTKNERKFVAFHPKVSE